MRRTHPLILIVGVGAVAFLYLPMLAVAFFSVNASPHGVNWSGFTLDWYRKLLSNELVLEATRNTLILAVISTAIATVIGTLLAIGLDRYPRPRWLRGMLDTMVEMPVVTPDIIFAAAALVAFAVVQMVLPRLQLGMATMVAAHVTFQISFVALVVRSRIAALGRDLDEAARDLYAGSWYVFRRVTLPLLLPAIVAGAMLAFTLSLDDFIISFFTAGKTNTLPIYIYASGRRGLSPDIHALSTLIVLVTIVLIFGLERLTRLRKPSAAA
jgi:spermidine/putrescine transport system permease protein